MNVIFKSQSNRLPELASNLTCVETSELPVLIGQSSWCTPLAITPVAALAFRLGKTLDFKSPHLGNSAYLSEYLSTISFPEGQSEPTIRGTKTYLPLTHIKRPFAEERFNRFVSEYVSALFERGLPSNRPDLRSSIGLPLAEITTNVLEHSKAENYWLCAQFYPTENELEFCIVDDGIGIRESLAGASIVVNDANDAIREAVQGSSAKALSSLSGDRGYGLGSTARLISGKDFRGKFCIISGDGCYLARYGQKPLFTKFRYFWNGAIICGKIRVPTAQVSVTDYCN